MLNLLDQLVRQILAADGDEAKIKELILEYVSKWEMGKC